MQTVDKGKQDKIHRHNIESMDKHCVNCVMLPRNNVRFPAHPRVLWAVSCAPALIEACCSSFGSGGTSSKWDYCSTLRS